MGLNPSTADENGNDPTIRRCIGFAREWGYGGMFMCNLFSYVTPDPQELELWRRSVPAVNAMALQLARSLSAECVVAWGALVERVKGGEGAVMEAMAIVKPCMCLGLTQDGYPKHPLYLAKMTPLIEMPEGI